ncbi:DNA-binding protein RFXANK-like [Asterias amurensis]|uniref:DNA-binding protein RFXANK-like n=1 Tax=Asterias amurensis TaxID=7602 RepID=UPI003AB76454
MDQDRLHTIPVVPNSSSAPNQVYPTSLHLVTSQVPMAGYHHQTHQQVTVMSDNNKGQAATTMLNIPIDYSSRPAIVHVQPSMMAVDRVLNSLSDQDQTSSDLEVQSVMCPETRNLLPTLKQVCPSRSSSSSKSSKSSYSPMRLQITMTNTKRGNIQSVTPTSLYNLSVHQLAAQGEIATMDEKLQEECELNESDPLGRTPLMWACAHRQTDIVKYLLGNEADVMRESDEGETALAYASSSGCLEIVRLLLEDGADVNKLDMNEGTPLLYAVYNNHPLCARLLLEAGADLTVQTEGGHSPLSLAVALGYREVQLAIEKHMIQLLQSCT